MIVKFSIEGKVVGKGRPRFARTGKFVKTYSTQQDISYENWVKTCFLNNVPETFKPFEGALSVNVIAYYSIPKSVSNKKREQMLNGTIRPTKKPDHDNILKSICDALNKIAYNDDSQIVTSHFEKFYGETEGCNVILSEIEKKEGERI